MKYWLYSEGNILGPYEPAEMLALPAFAEESLVCPESSTGDNPGDWRPATQVGEIASALSVGAGRSVTAGVLAGAYEYETGFNASARYFEDKQPGTGANYGDLLDTIDNILGAYKEGPEATPAIRPQESDYDLAEKFDIRLSRIQEELEAARWEKNLLLEKIRLKEMEDRKNRERIVELEAKLKSEAGRSDLTAREMEQVRHLADLKEKSETIRKIEEIRKEELALKEDSVPSPRLADGTPRVHPEEKGAPELQSRVLKSIAPSSEIKLERVVGNEPQAETDSSLTSRKLKSLGQTNSLASAYNSYHDKPLPGPEAAPPGAFKPEAVEPLPQQAGGLVYDFTVVTSQPATSQQFRIEPRAAAPAAQPYQQPAPAAQPYAQPAQQQFGQPYQPPAAQPYQQPAPAAQPQPVKPPTYDFGVHMQPSQQPAQQAAPFRMPDAAPAGARPAPQPAEQPADQMDKTQRIPVAPVKGKPEAKAPDKKVKKGGKLAFVAILVIFGSIAAGGLGYFFMGEGVSFSEFSMLNIGGKKKTSAMTSQLETKTAAAKPSASAQPAPASQAAAQQPEQAEPAKPAPQAEPQPAPEPEMQTNENIKKALDIVKGYKLSGGRGTIASWFANSFLTGSTGGANEEWTATPLHGDILVVQYRLIRPKQEPMVYQFEVDAAKQDIVRGINNNAIDLLESASKEKSAAAVPAKKPVSKPKVRKPSRPKEIPILPLPDEPAATTGGEAEPTGMENAQAEGSEKVKYLKAQESDEELF
jgi:hypothetical protein